MRPSCLLLLLASVVLFATSFMTWVQFRPQLPPGFDSQMMDAEMLAMLSATGWQGNASLAGLTVPNWFVPVLSFALATFALMQGADFYNAPRALLITFASYCVAHLGFLVVVVVLSGSGARLGLGSMLGLVASVVALAASWKRDDHGKRQAMHAPVRANASGGGLGYGRVIGVPRQSSSVDGVPASGEFRSSPH